jgi:hypothetical protein
MLLSKRKASDLLLLLVATFVHLFFIAAGLWHIQGSLMQSRR